LAQVYTRRLVATTLASANVFQDLFTAASGVTTILRDIMIVLPSGPPGFVAIDVLHGTSAYRLVQLTDLALNVFHLDMRQEIQPGEIVRGFSDHANVAIWLTGYELYG
jgi:hypothetical protein